MILIMNLILIPLMTLKMIELKMKLNQFINLLNFIKNKKILWIISLKFIINKVKEVILQKIFYIFVINIKLNALVMIGK